MWVNNYLSHFMCAQKLIIPCTSFLTVGPLVNCPMRYGRLFEGIYELEY